MDLEPPAFVGKKYFFPPSSPSDNLVFMRFDLQLSYLAATCHNVFVDIFSPESNPNCKDTFRVFPAMMVFRQAVELLLKAIIKDVVEKQPPTDTHNLSKLFTEYIQDSISPVQIPGDTKLFISEALAELQVADPGDAFRFGFKKDHQPHFTNMPETLDGAKLFEVCEKLWEHFGEFTGQCLEAICLLIASHLQTG